MSYLKSSFFLLIPILLWGQQALTSSFHWHLDNMTPESGTYSSVGLSGAKLWATLKCEGDSALWDSTINQYALVTQSAGTTEPVIGDETGSVELAVYINKYVTNGAYFTFYYNTTNYINLTITGTATNIEFVITHRTTAGGIISLTSTLNDCQDSTWYWVRAQWQQGADTTMMLAVYNDDSGEVGTLITKVTSTTAINLFGVVARYLYFGSTNLSATNSSNFIDRVTCYKGWYWWDPYKAATGDNHEFKKFNRYKKWKKF